MNAVRDALSAPHNRFSAALLVDRVSVSLWTTAEGHAIVDPGTGEAQGYAIPPGAGPQKEKLPNDRKELLDAIDFVWVAK